MGKHGPCRHCGVTSTPLWRNGPPEKPVLCNACGSRWRTKGSLANYTPLHAREKNEWEEPKFAKMKSISLKNKETKLLKRKKMCGMVETEYEMRFSELDENYARTFDGNASNRSSSGSAISYSESCAHFGVADANDWTGSAQSNVWDSSLVPVPSKKRSVIHPKPSPVEKLTKDLYSIWHEQQSSNLSGSSEEDLLVEGDMPMGSVEIGHGGVLLRYPSCKVIDEESEASSLPVDNKLSSEAYSRSSSFPVNSESKRTHFSDAGVDKNKKSAFQMSHEHAKREGVSPQKFSMVEVRNSPLRFVDLKDVVSLEAFMKHLTNDEQQRLMKYLPSIDTAKSWESLRNLFSSSLFMESLSYFQQLLQDGVFDLSFGQMSVEECRNLKFALLNSSKSRWVDHHGKLKDIKHKEPGADGGEKSGNFLLHYNSATTKRTRQIQKGQIQDSKRIMRSPNMAYRSSNTKPPLAKSSVQNPREIQSKELLATADLAGNEGACFSPTSLFTWPPDPSSELLFTDDSSEQDLLLDVRCSSSFPEAELLHHHPRNEKTSSNSSQAESFAAAEEESLCNFPSSSLRA